MARVRAGGGARRAHRRGLADDAAAAYGRVRGASRLPKDDPARTRGVDQALLGAAQTPLQTARGAHRLVTLAHEIAESGNQNARSDARVGAALARAALAGAAENARANAAARSEPAPGTPVPAGAGRRRPPAPPAALVFAALPAPPGGPPPAAPPPPAAGAPRAARSGRPGWGLTAPRGNAAAEPACRPPSHPPPSTLSRSPSLRTRRADGM